MAVAAVVQDGAAATTSVIAWESKGEEGEMSEGAEGSGRLQGVAWHLRGGRGQAGREEVFGRVLARAGHAGGILLS